MASEKIIVLITGANSGIGLSTVLALSQSSPNYHILLGTRSLSKGAVALSELQSPSTPHPGGPLLSQISLLELDITSPASILSAKSSIEATHGKLDILINNAGIIVTQPCDTLTHLRSTFETNVFGPYLLTEALEPLLKKTTLPDGRPYIINVSSEQGSISLRLDPEYEYRQVRGDIYRMSKAALNMMAACQRYNSGADDDSEKGWKVCAFNPGFCVTNLTGEEGRKMRVEAGARSPMDAALALVEIVQGKRDGDLEGNGIVDLDRGLQPW